MSLLPYTIRDIMLGSDLSNFVWARNISICSAFQMRETKFKQLFGIDLILFLRSLYGFEYIKFANTVLAPVPDGVSYNMATANRFGLRAAELIGELIHAGES